MIKNTNNYKFSNINLKSFYNSDKALSDAEIKKHITHCKLHDFNRHYFITITQDRQTHTSIKSQLIDYGRYIANVLLSQFHKNLKRCKQKRPAIYIGFIENSPNRSMSAKAGYRAGENFWHIHMIFSVHKNYIKKSEDLFKICSDDKNNILNNEKAEMLWRKKHPRGTIQINQISETSSDLFRVMNYSSKINKLNYNGAALRNAESKIFYDSRF